ncbi:MAG: CDP-glucose 4,6-dehydratase [Candidatus Nitrosopumilus sp. bin_6a]
MNPSFWKQKKIFLTGHTGFKGSWMSLWLQELEAEVVGFSNNIPTEPSLFNIANVEEGMKSIIADVRDLEKLTTEISDFQPEIIIHMAAQSLVQDSYNEPLETFSTNVMGTVNLFEAVKICKSAKVMINVTSDKCYEEKDLQRGFTESDPLGGHDPYSSSKGCAELITSAYRKSFFNKSKNSDISLASVRAGNVIGGGDWAKDRLIPDIMKGILKNESIRIRNPNYVRHWQHVLDPLNGYLMLAEKMWNEKEKFAESWNFGPIENNAKPVSWILEKFNELWGNGIKWELDDNEYHHENKFLKLDSSKSNSRLGWISKIELEEAIRLIVEWYSMFKKGEDMKKVTKEQIRYFSKIK